MTALSLGEWIEGFLIHANGNPDRGIGSFLRSYRVSAASVEPWVLLDPRHYTRSLLFQTRQWQGVLMCWSPGQRTTVHDHNQRPAWATLVRGKLAVRNFSATPTDADGTVFRIDEMSAAVLDDSESDCPAQAEAGIHEIRHGGRGPDAVSVHVYRRPMDSCGTYDLVSGRYRRVALAVDRDLSAQFGPTVDTL